jgi:hypothetical protein
MANNTEKKTAQKATERTPKYHRTIKGVVLEVAKGGKAFPVNSVGGEIGKLYTPNKSESDKVTAKGYAYTVDKASGVATVIESDKNAIQVAIPQLLSEYTEQVKTAQSDSARAIMIGMAIAQTESTRSICGVFDPQSKKRICVKDVSRIHATRCLLNNVPCFAPIVPVYDQWLERVAGVVFKGNSYAFTIEPSAYLKKMAKEENLLRNYKFVKVTKDKPEQDEKYIAKRALSFVKGFDAIKETAEGMEKSARENYLNKLANAVIAIIQKEIEGQKEV